MLVLSRKLDQAIAIGGASEFEHLVKVTVLGISNGTVRLGFEVDSSVPVHRWEVWQRIQGITATKHADEALEAVIEQ